MRAILVSDSHGNKEKIDFIFQNFTFDYFFFLGDGYKDLGGYFNYAAEIDDIRMDRINELIDEAQKQNKNDAKETVFITKKPGGSGIEYFTLHKVINIITKVLMYKKTVFFAILLLFKLCSSI